MFYGFAARHQSRLWRSAICLWIGWCCCEVMPAAALVARFKREYAEARARICGT